MKTIPETSYAPEIALRGNGDLQQLEFIKQQYNFLVDQKFHLEEIISNHSEGRTSNYLFERCAELTEEIVRLDEKRNEIIGLR